MLSKENYSKSVYLILILLIPFLAFSQTPLLIIEDNMVQLRNIELSVKDTTIKNYGSLIYPYNWEVSKSLNNKLITYPKTWQTYKDSNLVLAAYPPSWELIKIDSSNFIVKPTFKDSIGQSWILKRDDINCFSNDLNDCWVWCSQKSKVNEILIDPENKYFPFFFKHFQDYSLGTKVIKTPKNWKVHDGNKIVYPSSWKIVEINNLKYALPEIKFTILNENPLIIQNGNYCCLAFRQPIYSLIIQEVSKEDEFLAAQYAIFLLFNGK